MTTYTIDDPLPSATPNIGTNGTLFENEFIVDLHYIPVFDSPTEGSIGAILSLIRPPPEDYWLLQGSLPPGYPLLEYKVFSESKSLWIKIANEVWDLAKSADTIFNNVSDALRQHVKVSLRSLEFVSRVYDCIIYPSPACAGSCAGTLHNQWLKTMKFESASCNLSKHSKILTTDVGIDKNDFWLSNSNIYTDSTNAQHDAPTFHGTITSKFAVGRYGVTNGMNLFGPGASSDYNNTGSRLHLVYGESTRIEPPPPRHFNYHLTPSGYSHIRDSVVKLAKSENIDVWYVAGSVGPYPFEFNRDLSVPMSYGNDSSEILEDGVGLVCGVNWRDGSRPHYISNWGNGMVFSIPIDYQVPGTSFGTSVASPVIAGILSTSKQGIATNSIQRLHSLIMSCDNYGSWNKYIGFGTPDLCKYADLLQPLSNVNFTMSPSVNINISSGQYNIPNFEVYTNLSLSPTIWHGAPNAKCHIGYELNYASSSGDICIKTN